ncbi:uncharacterized protein LOC129302842 [Prosopis cineraria]|uniref:uncharacterized protein LOC129302842 n=1 Tax=Prosopis cineraria TaxID=364024 RepID=UPI00240FB3CA|nr:uncharacterized protein LOC129302842 [Prosopis cineraria]
MAFWDLEDELGFEAEKIENGKSNSFELGKKEWIKNVVEYLQVTEEEFQAREERREEEFRAREERMDQKWAMIMARISKFEKGGPSKTSDEEGCGDLENDSQEDGSDDEEDDEDDEFSKNEL